LQEHTPAPKSPLKKIKTKQHTKEKAEKRGKQR
jgi:hypothetical protein